MFEEVKARTLLSKRINADGWFHSNHSMNIYRGCHFACSYCDGMSEYYHVDNFQTNIQVKTNAPTVLRKELDRLYPRRQRSILDYTDNRNDPKKPIIGVSGGVSDSYQQAEKEYRLTRRILEVLNEYEYPVFLLTKSDLVLRDIELLKEINEKTYANICFSITQTDEEKKKPYEPNSPSTSDRLEALKTLRGEGIKGGVMAMPMIPYISDSLENMRKLVEEAKRVDAEFVLFSGLTLKPGRQKTCFYETVRRNDPEKLAPIMDIYSLDNRYGQPDYNKLPVNVMTTGHHICRKAGMNPRSIRHRCREEYESNHRILQKLLDMIYWMTYLLGYNRTRWKPLYETAVQLENGAPDLEQAYENGRLDDIIAPKLIPLVSETVTTGTCAMYEDIKTRVDQLAERDYLKLVESDALL